MTENELRNICKEIMTEQKLNYKQVADKSGLSQITISQFINGKKELKYKTIILIVNALGLSLQVVK